MPTSVEESMEAESLTHVGCPASNGHAGLLGRSCSPSDAVDMLAESASSEQRSPQENEKEGASEEVVSKSSRESTPVVTETMMAEEERLREERGDSSERQQVDNLSKMVEQQRYARLTHLLEKSSIYSSLLLKRMENQMKQQKENQKRKKGDGANEAGKPATTASGSFTATTGQASGKRGKGRPRKRRAEEEAYQLADYMDKKGKLKKRKVDEKEKSAVHGTQEVDTEEARYFNGELIPARQPKLVTGGVMRPYQLDGMEWLQVLYENGINGILADEMGLGKTLQCVGLIAHMIEMGVKGPFLVAAPLSTVANWVTEFKRFTPTIPVVLYHGTIKEREELRMKSFPRRRKHDKSYHQMLQPVLVTSYEICMKDFMHLADKTWKLLIVDEGHRIKNLNCKLIRILKTYNAANRLLLTGTPLQNNLAELWSLLNFILPDIFDDLNCFQSWFDFTSVVSDKDAGEKIIAQEKEQHVLSTLHQILSPFLLRRLKTDVEFRIPPKKEVLVYAPLTAAQERYYTSLLNNTILQMVEEDRRKRLAELGWEKENMETNGEVPEEEEEWGVRKSKRLRNKTQSYKELSDSQFEAVLTGEMEDPPEPVKEEEKPAPPATSVLNVKMQRVWVMLRKCCNHPYLLDFPLTPDGDLRIDNDLVTCCGKMLILDRLLPALLEEGHKVLIFSQWTNILDILEYYMEMREWRCARLDGSMPFQEREIEMTRFRESPDCNVFLLSTRAGGLGINLTAADTVIIYDSDWNPQCDLQAQDRCHRIGQTKPVMVYRIVTANTLDQQIVERAAGKRRLEKMVIHKGKFKGYSRADKNFTLEDLKELLKSVDHDHVVNSTDVISDEALRALLDRSFSSSSSSSSSSADRDEERKAGHKDDRLSGSDHGAHSDLFVVLEEKSDSGNILKSVNADNSPTRDGGEEPPVAQSTTSADTHDKAASTDLPLAEDMLITGVENTLEEMVTEPSDPQVSLDTTATSSETTGSDRVLIENEKVCVEAAATGEKLQPSGMVDGDNGTVESTATTSSAVTEE